MLENMKQLASCLDRLATLLESKSKESPKVELMSERKSSPAIEIDEHDIATQDQACEVLGNTLAKAFGKAEAVRRYRKLLQSVQQYGANVVCAGSCAEERALLSSPALDSLTANDRADIRLSYATERAAARFIERAIKQPVIEWAKLEEVSA